MNEKVAEALKTITEYCAEHDSDCIHEQTGEICELYGKHGCKTTYHIPQLWPEEV